MRDLILLYVNGERFEIRGGQVYQTLTDFLRQDLGLTGTKVVCAEGDCGSCTIMLGRPQGGRMLFNSIDGCIQYLWQLDGCHVVTVEGICFGDELHPIQQALVDSFGSQCGYCTPGFVMALADMLEQQIPITRNSVKYSLTGNLCRCTGYEQILEGALTLSENSCQTLSDRYHDPDMVEALKACSQESVEIRCVISNMALQSEVRVALPVSLQEAVAFKAALPQAVVISGGTDVSVQMNKGKLRPNAILCLSHLQELKGLEARDDVLRIGAKVTWAELDHYC